MAFGDGVIGASGLLRYGFSYANKVFPVQKVGLLYLLFVDVFLNEVCDFYFDLFTDFDLLLFSCYFLLLYNLFNYCCML